MPVKNGRKPWEVVATTNAPPPSLFSVNRKEYKMINSAGMFLNNNAEIIVEVDENGTILRCDNVKKSPTANAFIYPKNVEIKNDGAGASITINYAQVIDGEIVVNYQSVSNGSTRTLSDAALVNGMIYIRFTSSYTVTVTNGTLEKYIAPASGLQGHHYYIRPKDPESVVTVEFS